jgi:hypothetical protein
MRNRPSIIKNQKMQPAAQPVLTGPRAALRGSASAHGCAVAAQPEIKLRKSGDLIESIEITCPCGNQMVIECLYDPRIAEVTP